MAYYRDTGNTLQPLSLRPGCKGSCRARHSGRARALVSGQARVRELELEQALEQALEPAWAMVPDRAPGCRHLIHHRKRPIWP